MFARWEENRAALEKCYAGLPTSVFQADLNDTNVLLDDLGNFAGIYDFNLAGKDVFLNYLFREIYEGSLDEERNAILSALKVAAGVYAFSEAEKEAALPLYRCLKPLWYTRVEALKDAAATKPPFSAVWMRWSRPRPGVSTSAASWNPDSFGRTVFLPR